MLATSAWRSCVAITAPRRLRTAEKATARRGGRARVPTVVATAFAVSWKPFVKSKASATVMVRTRSKVCVSGILDRDALEHVRYLLAAIEGVLEEYIQVFELDDLERGELAAEELGDGTA